MKEKRVMAKITLTNQPVVQFQVIQAPVAPEAVVAEDLVTFKKIIFLHFFKAFFILEWPTRLTRHLRTLKSPHKVADSPNVRLVMEARQKKNQSLNARLDLEAAMIQNAHQVSYEASSLTKTVN
jgi:hypothetical protein